MSITLKAKTTRQVIDEGLRTENWDLKGWYKTDKPAETADFEKPMWVSLEEVQKIEAKIAEALKELKCCDQDECCLFTDDSVCYDDDCIIAAAKTILNSALSTSENKQSSEVSK